MLKSFKIAFYFLTFMVATIVFARAAKAQTVCPSDVVKPFVGQWKGSGLLISAQGTQKQMVSKDAFSVVDCQKFEITVNYLNDAGAVTRTVDLVASPDLSGQAGLFTINGSVTEGASSAQMTGSFQKIQDGTLLGLFSAALGGQPAYFTELMNVATLATGDREIVRTLQIFDKRGGHLIAARVTTEVALPAGQ